MRMMCIAPLPIKIDPNAHFSRFSFLLFLSCVCAAITIFLSLFSLFENATKRTHKMLELISFVRFEFRIVALIERRWTTLAFVMMTMMWSNSQSKREWNEQKINKTKSCSTLNSNVCFRISNEIDSTNGRECDEENREVVKLTVVDAANPSNFAFMDDVREWCRQITEWNDWIRRIQNEQMKSIHRDGERGKESEWCLEHTRMSHIGFVHHHHQHAQLTAIYIHCVLSPPSNLLSLTSCVKQNQIFTALLGSLSIMICSRCDIIESHMNTATRKCTGGGVEMCVFETKSHGQVLHAAKNFIWIRITFARKQDEEEERKWRSRQVIQCSLHRLEMECRNRTRVCVSLLTFLQLIFVSVANARRFGLFTVCLF